MHAWRIIVNSEDIVVSEKSDELSPKRTCNYYKTYANTDQKNSYNRWLKKKKHEEELKLAAKKKKKQKPKLKRKEQPPQNSHKIR